MQHAHSNAGFQQAHSLNSEFILDQIQLFVKSMAMLKQ